MSCIDAAVAFAETGEELVLVIDEPKKETEEMKIVKATEDYESWLATSIPILKEDLKYKHQRMADDLFEFMRATFYRWMELWPKYCEDLDDATEVLSVGDLHSDNFGTWRDIEGRLVWGIYDFDEAYPLPYTLDLVRLATSVLMALDQEMSAEDLAAQIVKGYKDSLKSGGKPFVLAEDNGWLRDLMLENLKYPEKFWKKLEELPTEIKPLPTPVDLALKEDMPQPGLTFRPAHRRAGLGSLGRRRFVGLIDLGRSNAAREAKELTASSVVWAQGGKSSNDHSYVDIMNKSVRSQDPFLRVRGNWVVRRLSPDYSRVELASLGSGDRRRLLYSMGWETANVHLGSGDTVAKKVRKDLRDREEGWLAKAAEKMFEATVLDYGEWQDYWLGER